MQRPLSLSGVVARRREELADDDLAAIGEGRKRVRADVARVAVAVVVAVGLRRIGDGRAVVDRIAEAVAVGVRAARRRPGRPSTEPVQFSAMSHASTALRQTVDEGLKASAGHAAPEPVQFSARSQTPATLRQTVLDELRRSRPGSSRSSPCSSRRRRRRRPSCGTPCSTAGSRRPGRRRSMPSQFSATSQTPAELRHGEPDATLRVGRTGGVGCHRTISATSHDTGGGAAAWRRGCRPGACRCCRTPSQTSSVQTFESAVHGRVGRAAWRRPGRACSRAVAVLGDVALAGRAAADDERAGDAVRRTGLTGRCRCSSRSRRTDAARDTADAC